VTFGVPVAGQFRRLNQFRNLEMLRSYCYRAGTNQAIAGSASSDPVQFNAFYQDKIDTIDTNFGHVIATNFWWIAPVAGEVQVNYSVEGTLAAGTTTFRAKMRISRDSGATFPDTISRGNLASLAVGTNDTSSASGRFLVNKGDYLQISVDNNSATACAVVFQTPNLANRLPPLSSFFQVSYVETNY
jgi:hypothetical protein